MCQKIAEMEEMYGVRVRKKNKTPDVQASTDTTKERENNMEDMQLQIFENPEFGSVRTIDEDGTVLFCGSDVAKALGYASPKDAISAHTKGAVKRRTLTKGGEQDMLFVPEGDVYRLVTPGH